MSTEDPMSAEVEQNESEEAAQSDVDEEEEEDYVELDSSRFIESEAVAADWPIQDVIQNGEAEEEEAPEVPYSAIVPTEKGKGPYFCDLCRKTFTNYGSYRRHLRMHYCDKKYTCHLCGRQFFRRYLWVKHQEKIHGNDPNSFRCPHCGDWSQSPEGLRDHLRTQHKRTNGCKDNWTKDQTIYSPIPAASVSPQPNAPANKKPKRKRRKKLSKVTTVSSSPPQNVLLKIPVIKQMTGQSASPPNGDFVPDRETEALNSEIDFFSCQECDVMFGTEEDLDEHNVALHKGKRNTSRYGRRRKQRVLYNSDSYPSKRNRKTATDEEEGGGGEEEEHHSEPIDHKTEVKEEQRDSPPNSMLSQLLQQPVVPTTFPKNTSHRGNFYCEKCRRFFINRSSYMRHKKMHTGIKPFTCEYCCLSFFRSESLTTHKKKHNKVDEPEFRCYVCGYKAANCSTLRNHFYSICASEAPVDKWNDQANRNKQQKEDSSGSEPIKAGSRNIAGFCTLCNRAFFNVSNYQRHARLHSTVAATNAVTTTYACGICQKIFTTKSTYDEHVLAHSKENTALDISGKDVPTSLELLKQFSSFSGEEDQLGFTDMITVKEEPQDYDEDFAAMVNETLSDPTNGHVFCCRLCPLAFTDKKTYLLHLRSHGRNEEQSSASYSYCRFCGRPHSSKTEMGKHEVECFRDCQVSGRMHDCYNCGVHFDNSSAIREHVKAAHLNDRVALRQSAQSEMTTVYRPNPEEEEEEAKQLPDSGRYKCGKCSDTFSDISSIFTHFQSAHGVAKSNKTETISSNPSDRILVNPCANSKDTDTKAPNINGLVNGSTSIMKQLLSSPPVASSSFISSSKHSEPQSFSCNLCLKPFDDRRVAEAHEQQAHVMVDWFRCSICDKAGSKKSLMKHMATHMHKVGSIVTTIAERDSESDDCDESSKPGREKTSKGFSNQSAATPFVSMFCQLCKKVISSLATLERHRHAAHDGSIQFPYICCLPGCGKGFALKVEALAHLQTQHRDASPPSNLTPSIVIPSIPKASEHQRGRWLLGNHWKNLIGGAVGPFSQSLVQLSMAAAENEGVTALKGDQKSFGGKTGKTMLDIYQNDMLESLASTGELTITKVATEVEEITVEPLVDVVRQVMGGEDDASREEDEAGDQATNDGTFHMSEQLSEEPEEDPRDYLEEGDLVIEEGRVSPSNQSTGLMSPGQYSSQSFDSSGIFSPASLLSLSYGVSSDDNVAHSNEQLQNYQGSTSDSIRQTAASAQRKILPCLDPALRNRKVGKELLRCQDCQSVFTNVCSWKRHRKLHLGIMKHKCPHCPRMFYRKDHCDKHLKTHDANRATKKFLYSVRTKELMDGLDGPA